MFVNVVVYAGTRNEGNCYKLKGVVLDEYVASRDLDVDHKHDKREFLTQMTTWVNELSKQTTCERNCQKYHGGTFAGRHVCHAATNGGGRGGRHGRWRHVVEKRNQ